MFHPFSLFFSLLILLPNLLMIRWKPVNMPNPSEVSEPPLLVAAERLGQPAVLLIPVFHALQVRTPIEMVALGAMFAALLFYYAGWLQFYRNGRDYHSLFAPLLGVPVPMAVAPVVYFILLAVVLHSPYQLVAAGVFAVGHIPISWRTHQHLVNK
jgi:hypothetical protein